eukprot:2172944-Amphidinium_carterae.1
MMRPPTHHPVGMARPTVGSSASAGQRPAPTRPLPSHPIYQTGVVDKRPLPTTSQHAGAPSAKQQRVVFGGASGAGAR